MLFNGAIACCLAYVLYCVFDWWRRRDFVEGIPKKGVFITGCDTGFGAALARRLDDLGCIVFAGCLTGEGAEKLQQNASSRLRTLQVDVRDSNSITQACDVVRGYLTKENAGG